MEGEVCGFVVLCRTAEDCAALSFTFFGSFFLFFPPFSPSFHTLLSIIPASLARLIAIPIAFLFSLLLFLFLGNLTKHLSCLVTATYLHFIEII